VTSPQLRIRSVVIDCPDPAALAGFYGQLLGGEVRDVDSEWSEIHLEEPTLKLAFQRVADYSPPSWPSGVPQQVHIDITVPDLAEASQRAVKLGGRVLDGPVDEGGCIFQVHADPTGHPFCLCMDE
jgi:predicted enzyme related to lactoylglutathione lyase